MVIEMNQVYSWLVLLLQETLPNISLSCSNIIPYYIESHRQTRKLLLLIFNNYLLGY